LSFYVFYDHPPFPLPLLPFPQEGGDEIEFWVDQMKVLPQDLRELHEKAYLVYPQDLEQIELGERMGQPPQDLLQVDYSHELYHLNAVMAVTAGRGLLYPAGMPLVVKNVQGPLTYLAQLVPLNDREQQLVPLNDREQQLVPLNDREQQLVPQYHPGT